MQSPVATTGLLVAALRAEESARPARLFEDPFAAALAGEAGRTALAGYRQAAGPGIPIIEVRTRYYDEAIGRALAQGARQVVILAAGMDARAYRLDWPAGTRLFEVDQEEVMAAKAQILLSARPRCERIAVASDLGADWPAALAAHGFDGQAQTVWLVEGLLQYLDEALVAGIFGRIDALCPPGSSVIYDVVGRRLLESPFLAGTLRYMSGLGAPWRFGTDDPAALVGRHGWPAVITDPARIGNDWGRWPFPAAPAEATGAPRGYLVTARKP